MQFLENRVGRYVELDAVRKQGFMFLIWLKYLMQAWLDRHGPFDVIVDGANIGLYNQNFSDGGFNFFQVCDSSYEAVNFWLMQVLVEVIPQLVVQIVVVIMFSMVHSARSWVLHSLNAKCWFAVELCGERDQSKVRSQERTPYIVASQTYQRRGSCISIWQQNPQQMERG